MIDIMAEYGRLLPSNAVILALLWIKSSEIGTGSILQMNDGNGRKKHEVHLNTNMLYKDLYNEL